ncbi:MAG: CoA pyrophosphatase [Frankiaceae bacterium]|nr:CoA pyrophosphatase [Frankiaceae bacterium]
MTAADRAGGPGEAGRAGGTWPTGNLYDPADPPAADGMKLSRGARLIRAASRPVARSAVLEDLGVLPSAAAGMLAAFERREADRPDLRHAAVALVLMIDEAGQPCFLLIRRPSKMREHPGQYALPGGRIDAGETAVEAALREVDEEIGLRLGESAVLGMLDDFVTRSGYVMTPFVVWGGINPAMSPSPDEVEILHVIPLHDIDIDPRLIGIPESDRPVIQLPFLGDFVHAPTAAIIFQFREVVLRGRSTRVDMLEQPVFAWR